MSALCVTAGEDSVHSAGFADEGSAVGELKTYAVSHPNAAENYRGASDIFPDVGRGG
jgi:hypothetical protein